MGKNEGMVVGSVPKTLLLKTSQNPGHDVEYGEEQFHRSEILSLLPDHLHEVIGSLPIHRDDNDDNRQTNNSRGDTGNCQSTDTTIDSLRCKYCYKFYDCLSRWKPPMQSIYFLQCKRHRKSLVYWCKYHQIAFDSKASIVDHCNQSSAPHRSSARVSVTCGGMPFSYSWTYHRFDLNRTHDDRSSCCVAGKRLSSEILSRKLTSWTYTDEDTEEPPIANKSIKMNSRPRNSSASLDSFKSWTYVDKD